MRRNFWPYKLQRVGTPAVPMLVNGVRVDLPAIEARGEYIGDRAEFVFFLEEPSVVGSVELQRFHPGDLLALIDQHAAVGVREAGRRCGREEGEERDDGSTGRPQAPSGVLELQDESFAGVVSS